MKGDLPTIHTKSGRDKFAAYLNAAFSSIFTLAFYLAIGGGIYLIAYGEPHAFTLSVFVMLIAWPLALIWWFFWWSIWWLLIGVVCLLIFLGLKHLKEAF